MDPELPRAALATHGSFRCPDYGAPPTEPVAAIRLARAAATMAFAANRRPMAIIPHWSIISEATEDRSVRASSKRSRREKFRLMGIIVLAANEALADRSMERRSMRANPMANSMAIPTKGSTKWARLVRIRLPGKCLRPLRPRSAQASNRLPPRTLKTACDCTNAPVNRTPTDASRRNWSTVTSV
jgi:hypothetical protein